MEKYTKVETAGSSMRYNVTPVKKQQAQLCMKKLSDSHFEVIFFIFAYFTQVDNNSNIVFALKLRQLLVFGQLDL